MALTTSSITGRVPMPDDTASKAAEVIFTLSGFDTEGNQVIPGGASRRFVLDADGNLPAGAELWRNTEGMRGTAYRVMVRWVEADRRNRAEDRTNDLGWIQVGDDASYTLPDLLANPAGPAPGWYETVPRAVWEALIAGLAEIATKADQSALDAEVDARTAGQAANAEAIAAETERAAGVEAGLSADIDAEIDDRKAAVAGLQAQVDAKAAQSALLAEISRATGVEAGLSGDLDSEIDQRKADVANLQAQVDGKASQTALAAEVASRASADTNLQAQVNTKASQSALAAETASRESAVVAETTARQSEDGNLQSQIDALSSASVSGLAGPFVSAASGAAATSDGAQFIVADPATGRVDLYRNASGAAVFQMEWLQVRVLATRQMLEDAVASGLSLSAGTALTAGGQIYVFEAGATAIPDLPGVVPGPTITGDHFGFSVGAVGIKNRLAVEAAAAYAAGRRITINCPTDFQMSGTLTMQNMDLDIDYVGSGRAIFDTSNCIIVGGDIAGIQSVTEMVQINYTFAGDTTRCTRMQISDTSAYAAGDIVRVVSDDIDPDARTGYSARRGEHAVVGRVDGNYVYLTGYLEDAAFYTSNIRIGRLPRHKVGIRFPKIVSSGAATGAVVTAWNLVQPRLHFDLQNLGWIGVGLRGTFRSWLTGSAHSSVDAVRDSLTYGVHPVGCTEDVVVGFEGGGLRHLFTTGFNTVAAGTDALSAFGACRGVTVIDALSMDAAAPPFDDHEGARRTKFVRCASHSARGNRDQAAFQTRGRDTIIESPFADDSHGYLISASRDGKGRHMVMGGMSFCPLYYAQIDATSTAKIEFVGHINRPAWMSSQGTIYGYGYDVTITGGEIEVDLTGSGLGGSPHVVDLKGGAKVTLSSPKFKVTPGTEVDRIFVASEGNLNRIEGHINVEVLGANALSRIASSADGAATNSIARLEVDINAEIAGVEFQGSSWSYLDWKIRTATVTGNLIKRSSAANDDNLGRITNIAAAPQFVGQLAMAGGVEYRGWGTSSAADWIRMLKAGDGGLLGRVDIPNIDLNAEYFGFWANNASSAPPIIRPDGLSGNSRWAGVTLGSQNSVLQIAARTDASQALYVRTKSNSGWSPWLRISTLPV